jgi:hypothetical protein
MRIKKLPLYLKPGQDARDWHSFFLHTLSFGVCDFKGLLHAQGADPTRHARYKASSVSNNLFQEDDDKRKSNCVNPRVGQKFANKSGEPVAWLAYQKRARDPLESRRVPNIDRGQKINFALQSRRRCCYCWHPVGFEPASEQKHTQISWAISARGRRARAAAPTADSDKTRDLIRRRTGGRALLFPRTHKDSFSTIPRR